MKMPENVLLCLVEIEMLVFKNREDAIKDHSNLFFKYSLMLPASICCTVVLWANGIILRFLKICLKSHLVSYMVIVNGLYCIALF